MTVPAPKPASAPSLAKPSADLQSWTPLTPPAPGCTEASVPMITTFPPVTAVAKAVALAGISAAAIGPVGPGLPVHFGSPSRKTLYPEPGASAAAQPLGRMGSADKPRPITDGKPGTGVPAGVVITRYSVLVLAGDVTVGDKMATSLAA